MYNKLLLRQFQKCYGNDAPDERLASLLKIVSQSYEHYEQDRLMLERSIEISSQELAELYQAQKFAHDNLKTLFENIEEVFFSFSFPDKKLLQISSACEKVYGNSAQTLQKEPLLLYRLILDDDKAQIKAALESLAVGISFHQEYRIKHKNGSVKWVETRISPTMNKHGELIRIDGTTSDISEKRIAENLLSSSQKETSDYKNALDQSLIVFISDARGKLTFVNENFCRISKYNHDELIGKDHSILNSGFHPNNYMLDIWKIIKSGKVWRGEMKNMSKDGSTYWVDETIVPFLDESGSPFQYLSVNIDITERKNAEIKIKDSEEKFRTIIQSSHDLIQSTDQNGNIEFVNAAWLRNLGYTNEELSNKNITDVIFKDCIISYLTDSKKVLEYGGQHSNIKTKFVTKWGDSIIVEGNISPVYKDNAIVGTLAFFHDVTEREKHELAIVAANKNLKLSIDQLSEAQKISQLGSWILNFDTNKVSGSDEFYKIFDLDKTKLSGLKDEFCTRYLPEDRLAADEIISNSIIEKSSFKYEARLIMTDGSLRNIHTNGKPLKDDFGNIIGLQGTVQDITQRKLVESELEKNILELKKTNTELDKFVYSVSHDLRAPLSSMLGVIDIAKGDTEDNLAIEHFNILKESVVKLDGFISDILDYSRNCRMDVRMDEIILKEMLQEITNNLKFIGGKGQQVDIRFDIDESLVLKSDRRRLSIILNNLISNAIRYHNSQIDNPFVDIAIDMSDTETDIIVKDNGIGIPKELQEKVFDMFYRISENSSGTGLGLYIVKETVHNLNGKIEIQSEPGAGSTFKIKLPNY